MTDNYSATYSKKYLLRKKNLSKKFLKVRQAHQRELLDDYIELIADLIQEHGKARQIDLALRLGVSQPTVSKKIKQLLTDNLIQQRPYHSLFLTDKGKKLAYKNQKKHKIVESFLLALGISHKIAHQDAEGIEHHVSHETLLTFIYFMKNIKYHCKNPTEFIKLNI